MKLHERLATSAFTLTLLLSSALTSTANAAPPAQCGSVVPRSPEVKFGGPLLCTCSGASLTVELADVTLSGTSGGSGSGGTQANCYTSETWIPGGADMAPGTEFLLIRMDLPVTITRRKCDTSGCVSILFGLIRLGGASCEIESVLSPAYTIPNYALAGPCPFDSGSRAGQARADG